MTTQLREGPIATNRVTGRRELHFNSLDEILADAERLASGPVRCLGNWSCGQAMSHLARTMKMSLDGATFRAPWWLRLIGPLLKKRMLSNPMQPGFKLPRPAADKLIPAGPVSTEQAVAELRTMIGRLKREPQRAPSPVFGPMTAQEWNQLHCRHAELHLSFIVP